jgi:DNA-binding GntR family transcriptional regulator
VLTSIAEHRDMLRAIAAGQAERASSLLRQHVLMSRERTLHNYRLQHAGAAN